MPNLSPRPYGNPPSWWDHLRAHRGDTVASLAALVMGLMMLVSIAAPRLEAAPAIEALPWGLGLGVALLLLVGGAALLAAIYGHAPTQTRAVMVYRVGLVGHLFGWIAWSCALLLAPGPTYWTTVVWAWCAALGSAAGLLDSLAFDWREYVLRWGCHAEGDDGKEAAK